MVSIMFKSFRKLASFPTKVDKKLLYTIAPVDQFGAQKFCLGDNGFTRSYLAIALRTQDEQLRQAILSGISERVSRSEGDKTDRELIESLVPRSVQSPSEIAAYVKYFNELHPAEPPISVESVPGSVSSESVIEQGE